MEGEVPSLSLSCTMGTGPSEWLVTSCPPGPGEWKNSSGKNLGTQKGSPVITSTSRFPTHSPSDKNKRRWGRRRRGDNLGAKTLALKTQGNRVGGMAEICNPYSQRALALGLRDFTCKALPILVLVFKLLLEASPAPILWLWLALFSRSTPIHILCPHLHS